MTQRAGVKHRVRRGTSLWQRVAYQPDCWEWIGARTSAGYGLMDGRYVHRLAWELTRGPIPKGVLVLHHCDNRVCVRPSHLFLGSYLDNVRDMIAKGRAYWQQPRADVAS